MYGSFAPVVLPKTPVDHDLREDRYHSVYSSESQRVRHIPKVEPPSPTPPDDSDEEDALPGTPHLITFSPAAKAARVTRTDLLQNKSHRRKMRDVKEGVLTDRAFVALAHAGIEEKQARTVERVRTALPLFNLQSLESGLALSPHGDGGDDDGDDAASAFDGRPYTAPTGGTRSRPTTATRRLQSREGEEEEEEEARILITPLRKPTRARHDDDEEDSLSPGSDDGFRFERHVGAAGRAKQDEASVNFLLAAAHEAAYAASDEVKRATSMLRRSQSASLGAVGSSKSGSISAANGGDGYSRPKSPGVLVTHVYGRQGQNQQGFDIGHASRVVRGVCFGLERRERQMGYSAHINEVIHRKILREMTKSGDGAKKSPPRVPRVASTHRQKLFRGKLRQKDDADSAILHQSRKLELGTPWDVVDDSDGSPPRRDGPFGGGAPSSSHQQLSVTISRRPADDGAAPRGGAASAARDLLVGGHGLLHKEVPQRGRMGGLRGVPDGGGLPGDSEPLTPGRRETDEAMARALSRGGETPKHARDGVIDFYRQSQARDAGRKKKKRSGRKNKLSGLAVRGASSQKKEDSRRDRRRDHRDHRDRSTRPRSGPRKKNHRRWNEMTGGH